MKIISMVADEARRAQADNEEALKAALQPLKDAIDRLRADVDELLHDSASARQRSPSSCE
jgi:hypothetical protein